MEAVDFEKRVRERAELDNADEARGAIAAVFSALRARISPHSGQNVAAQLPHEIRQLWESGRAQGEGGSERMDLRDFLDRIQNSPGVKDVARASAITIAVFSTMREQITEDAADIVESELPPDIRELWVSSRAVRERYIQEMPFEFEAPVPPSSQDTIPGRTEHPEPAQHRPTVQGEYGSDTIGPAAADVFRHDDQIADEIRELFEASDEVDAADVNVMVRQGKVTLSGHVTSAQQSDAAVRIASQALGATSVENRLSVSGL